MATIMIFEVIHDKFNGYGISKYVYNNLFPQIKYSNVKTTVYCTILPAGMCRPAVERHRLKCYDSDWFIELQLYWTLSICWMLSTAGRSSLQHALPHSGGARMAWTVQWPGYRLSDQDVLTEDRGSVFSTPYREIEWVHHRLLTNGFRGTHPAAARSYKVSQSSAEVKNA
jgi:hypothetical protein